MFQDVSTHLIHTFLLKKNYITLDFVTLILWLFFVRAANFIIVFFTHFIGRNKNFKLWGESKEESSATLFADFCPSANGCVGLVLFDWNCVSSQWSDDNTFAGLQGPVLFWVLLKFRNEQGVGLKKKLP